MPVVFREGVYRFHFYSFEGSPREPVHIHVARPSGDAKLWLFPEVRVAYNRGLTAREQRIVLRIANDRRQEIVDAWNSFFARTD